MSTLCLRLAFGGEARPLVFCGDQDYPPIAFLEKGLPHGMDVDLVKALGAELAQPIQVQLMDWNLAQERVLSGEADALIGMSVTEERKTRFDFASAAFQREFSLVVRAGDLTIGALGDLKDKKVGVTAGGFPRSFLEARGTVPLVLVKNYREGLDLLKRGVIDALAADRWVAAYVIEKESITGVTILAKPFATAPIAIAVKKGNTALLRRIDQALLHLTADGTISEIEARWRPQEMLFFSRARVQTLILRTALITTGLLLIAMMIWVTTLRKQIGIRQCVEDRLRTLTEASFEGIAVCEDGVMVDANDQLVKMLGYERSELIGKPVSELIAPNSREFVHQAIKTGLSTPYEHDALRKDGSIFTVEVCGRNLTTDGRHLRVTAVRDVSERKRAEEALRRSEEKFARFFRSTPAATAVTVPSSGGMILDVNEEFTRLLGYSREEAVGRTTVELGIFANPEDRDRLLRLIQDKTELKQCELRLQARNGAIVIGQLSAQFTEIDGQRVLLAAFVDLTQRKEAEENLRASREQLRALTGRLQAVREEERTRIAREIHDVLAQELTRMKIDLGWLSKRLHQITKDPEQAGLFERLNSLNHLADHTISTVQKIAAELRPVALDSLGLSAAIEWQAEEFEARTGIRCDAIVPEQDFELDRNSATNLFRIVQESLTNIVRHAQATKVEIILELEADQLRLEIQDNGMGFDPRRLKDPHSLGLLGMRERALLLDGEFEISGDPGKGTRVSVTMPVHKRLHKVENFTSREEPVLS